jgi:hypothetical protein
VSEPPPGVGRALDRGAAGHMARREPAFVIFPPTSFVIFEGGTLGRRIRMWEAPRRWRVVGGGEGDHPFARPVPEQGTTADYRGQQPWGASPTTTTLRWPALVRSLPHLSDLGSCGATRAGSTPAVRISVHGAWIRRPPARLPPFATPPDTSFRLAPRLATWAGLSWSWTSSPDRLPGS